MPSIALPVDLVRTRTFHSGFHGCLGSDGLGGHAMWLSGPYAMMLSRPPPPSRPASPGPAKMPFGIAHWVAVRGSSTFSFVQRSISEPVR